YAALDAVPDEVPAVTEPRTFWLPAPHENVLGAWAARTKISRRTSGKLSGRRIALKDNVCLAGVPMTIGAAILQGYVPEVDATIVTRILDAGGEISGKTVWEYYRGPGGGRTPGRGPVNNRCKPGHS